jgi:DNA end-binding protein Ku
MARSISTATISFGLVTIPVRIFSTAEHTAEVRFHMIHAGCGERVHYEYVCPKHGAVTRDEIIKGFELTKNNYVELTKEELKALEAVSSGEISIREFVPATAVDPLYVDASYYLGPDKGGGRPYRLLRDALDRAELVGIATYAARGKQYVTEVRPYEDGLVMHQLRYADEVKSWDEVEIGTLPKPTSAELDLADKLIDQLKHDEFDPSAYKDEVKERVRDLIAQKAKGGEIEVPERVTAAPTTDLMAALKASLEGKAAPKRANGRANGETRAHGKRSARRAQAGDHAPRAPRKSSSTHAQTRRSSKRSRAHA